MQKAEEFAQRLKTINTFGAAIACGLLALTLFLGFLPIVAHVYDNKYRVFKAFQQIPKEAIMQIILQRNIKISNKKSEFHSVMPDSDNTSSTDGESDDEQELTAKMRRLSRRKVAKLKDLLSDDVLTMKRRVSVKNRVVAWKSKMYNTGYKVANYMGVVFKMSPIYVIVMVYFIGTNLWEQNQVQQTVLRHLNTYYYTAKRANLYAEVTASLLSPHCSIDQKFSIQQTLNSAAELDEVLMYGSELLDIVQFQDLQNSETIFNLLFVSSCDEEICGKLSTIGLAHWVTEMNLKMKTWIQESIDQHPTECFESASVINNIMSDEMEIFQDSLFQLADDLLLSCYSHVSSITSIRIQLTTVFIGVMIVTYLLFYRKFISRTDREIRNTRSMFLMVPGHIFDEVPALLNAFRGH